MVETLEKPLEIPTDFNSDIIHYVDSDVDPDKSLCGKFVGNERWTIMESVDCIVCRDLMKNLR